MSPVAATLLLATVLAPGPRAQAEPAELTWIFLRTGPKSGELAADEAAAAMNGHFANMQRLSDAGHLLVAGPLGPPRAEPDHRGIFVIDEPDPERALELASSDPAVAAGIFRLEAHPWRSSDPLRRIVELDRADLTARAAASPTGEATWSGRAYVLATVTGPAAADLVAPLAAEGLILFHGRLGQAPGAPLLACLDATEAAEAEQLLAATRAEQGGEAAWLLHGWYATRGLVQLPFVREHPAAPTFDLRDAGDAPYARAVDVFGIRVAAPAGIPDAVTLRMAHLVAQYLDPGEDGEPDVAPVPEALVLAGPDTDVARADELVRAALSKAGLKLPESSPDGSYRG